MLRLCRLASTMSLSAMSTRFCLMRPMRAVGVYCSMRSRHCLRRKSLCTMTRPLRPSVAHAEMDMTVLPKPQPTLRMPPRRRGSCAASRYSDTGPCCSARSFPTKGTSTASPADRFVCSGVPYF